MHLKKSLALGLFVLIILGICTNLTRLNSSEIQDVSALPIMEETAQNPEMSSMSNSELINSLFNSKIEDYYELGYFPNVYESSLQATYYALYVLDAIGKLNCVNQTQIISYIMRHYDANSNSFIDKLAKRYLDTDFSLGYYYPLSSVLEVTCYAILSLEILDQLNLIDVQGAINFIWSCYNPITSGFIGQPYDSGLEDEFEIATLDNTYFAIVTLDLLMTDWFGNVNKRDALIQHVNGLQFTGGNSWDTGSFLNDEDNLFNSMSPLFEPNLFSSYYAIKTLEIFEMEQTIGVEDFHQFLAYLYDSKNDCFRISEWDFGVNYTDIVATALGLELSNVTSFSNISRGEIVTFLLDNRNDLGNWDGSTNIHHHELIDSFQIIRSLKNLGEISQLSLNTINEIGNATQLYYQYDGYSHLSQDYTSMNNLYTITSSFELFDRISELEIQTLYSNIRDSYDDNAQTVNSFSGYLLKNQGFNLLRSHPIEFYSSGKKNYIEEISQSKSHESTFHAIESLKKIFKLDDFDAIYNLMDLFNDIISTQFLNDSYEEVFGGFTAVYHYDASRSEFLSKKIYFEYSYYAIRCLELISKFLGLGDVNYTSYGLDTVALYNYIDRHIVDDSLYTYLDPQFTDNIEIILENTYFMIYMLKALNLFNKDIQEIKNYVVSNLDYSNIKNVYYSFKISEILELNINFDDNLVQGLVQEIFVEASRGFYLTPELNTICQEIFLWTCDMARNSEIGIDANYLRVVTLGGYNNMSVSLYNLILRDFGLYISFKFESEQLGTYTFNKLSNNYYGKNIEIPFSPANYPEIQGNLSAYEGSQKKIQVEISFRTVYTLNHSLYVDKTSTKVLMMINSSILASNKHPLTFGEVYINEFIDNTFNSIKKFTHSNFTSFSLFSLTYIPPNNSDYLLEIYLRDGIQKNPILIGNVTNEVNIVIDDDDGDEDKPINYFGKDIQGAIPMIVAFITIPGCVIAISTKQLKKSRNKMSR